MWGVGVSAGKDGGAFTHRKIRIIYVGNKILHFDYVYCIICTMNKFREISESKVQENYLKISTTWQHKLFLTLEQ